MNKTISTVPTIPNWMIWVQGICFAVLYAIWALPETILVRHICLIIGALLGLYEIYQFRHLFWSKRAIPAWLIVALFAWATFHLFFLSQDFAAQYEEYTSIWKRTAIGTIFALGFGIALINNRLTNIEQKVLWWWIYLGLLAPTVIYLIKYFLSSYGVLMDWQIPAYWRLYKSSALFYIPKTTYVCFCLPVLGLALGGIARNVANNFFLKSENLIYFLTVPLVLFVFYGENIKNGIVYSALLILLFPWMIVFSDFRKDWIAKLILIVAILSICAFFVINNIQSNASWKALHADAKIAIATETYDHWKYSGDRGYPVNELGIMVSVTNYERIAWGKVGLTLVRENPLGYGLIERSFGHIAKTKWLNSKLHQTHSGWLDLTLGLGLIGLGLIISCLAILIARIGQLQTSLDHSLALYPECIWWILMSLLVMWCTTEISQKIYFDNLIFWLAMASGMNVSLSDSIAV